MRAEKVTINETAREFRGNVKKEWDFESSVILNKARSRSEILTRDEEYLCRICNFLCFSLTSENLVAA